ncbi:MAG: TadE/TadG family type IV pilus assembly protein [Sphingobium sp.]
MSLIEFAFGAPLLLLMISGGAELANYSITKMRVSALALQVADNAARIGEGNLLSAKKITEAQINDLLLGALAQGGSLNINGVSSERQADESRVSNAKARIIISSLEPDPDTTNHPNKNWIHWQRCYGQATSYTPQYGVQGDDNLSGMGPTGRQVYAPANTAIIFVEVHYRYEPLFPLVRPNMFGIKTYSDMNTIAAMVVRDDRDLSQIYNTEAVTPSLCT